MGSLYENGGDIRVSSKKVLNLFKTTFTNSLVEKLQMSSVNDFGSTFEDYMKRLFEFGQKYNPTYSSNFMNSGPTFQRASHVKHRDFDSFMLNGFLLVQKFENLYSYKHGRSNSTSWSDFLLYKRMN